MPPTLRLTIYLETDISAGSALEIHMETVTKLEMRPVDELVPYVNNARQHSPEQIAQLRASLRAFGFVTPLIIDGAGNVIAGHGRLLAARAEGMTEVPCVLAEHLSDEQRRAYTLADNRLAEQATWDDEMVSAELEALRDAGFDIDLTGFDSDDIILAEPDEAEEDEFDPTLPDEPVTKAGDMWLLGRHRLMCGDATDREIVQRLMGEEKLDMLLTDPPYNVDITGGTEEHLKIANDCMPEEAFVEFLTAAFSAADPFIRPGCPFYIWHPDGADGYSFREACRRVGWQVRQCLIWVKQSATLSRQDYHWQHEPCLHGSVAEDGMDADQAELDHLSGLYGWTDGAGHRWYGDRKQTTVVQFDRPSKSEDHPTMKPVRLFDWLLRNSSAPGAVIGDFFCGSGTTLIACEQAGRTALCMELDPRYCDVIVRRWETLTGEKAVLKYGG